MKKLLAVMLSVVMAFSFAACAGKTVDNNGSEGQTEETTTIRIGAMAGPTAMGMSSSVRILRMETLRIHMRLRILLLMHLHL